MNAKQMNLPFFERQFAGDLNLIQFNAKQIARPGDERQAKYNHLISKAKTLLGSETAIAKCVGIAPQTLMKRRDGECRLKAEHFYALEGLIAKHQEH